MTVESKQVTCQVIVKLNTALPCGITKSKGVWIEEGTCGNPASVAAVQPMEGYPGQWILLPVCRECSHKMDALDAILGIR